MEHRTGTINPSFHDNFVHSGCVYDISQTCRSEIPITPVDSNFLQIKFDTDACEANFA